MSVVGEVVGIIACVAAIISAYKDGSKVLTKIKDKRAARHKPAPTWCLDHSLHQSPHDIESERDRSVARLGQTFVRGDEIAIRTLDQIKVEIKAALFEHLVEALQDDEMSDFTIIIDASDLGRDRTIKALMELRQRLLVAMPIIQVSYQPAMPAPRPQLAELPATNSYKGYAPIWQNQPPPISSYTFPSLSRHQSELAQYAPEVVSPEMCTTESNANFALGTSPRLRQIEEDQPSPSSSTTPPPSTSYSPADKPGRKTEEDDYSPSYLPRFSLRFKRKPRSKSETLPRQSNPSSQKASLKPFQTGAVDPRHERLSAQMSPLDSTRSLSSSPNSHSSAFMPCGEFEDSTNAWRSSLSDRQEAAPPVTSAPWQKKSDSVADTFLNLPTPTEENNFLGFCRGAWKMQNGSSSAFKQRLEFNSGWSQSQVPYLACSSNRCAFACRLPLDKVNMVWRSNKGLAFRWSFLAKSHVQQEKAEKEQYAYQCMFCTLTGLDASVYFGIDTLLQHVTEHRNTQLPREVLHRARCAVGRVAQDDEDFDINIYPVVSVEAAQQRRPSATLSDSLQFAEPGVWEHGRDSMFSDYEQWR